MLTCCCWNDSKAPWAQWTGQHSQSSHRVNLIMASLTRSKMIPPAIQTLMELLASCGWTKALAPPAGRPPPRVNVSTASVTFSARVKPLLKVFRGTFSPSDHIPANSNWAQEIYRVGGAASWNHNNNVIENNEKTLSPKSWEEFNGLQPKLTWSETTQRAGPPQRQACMGTEPATLLLWGDRHHCTANLPLFTSCWKKQQQYFVALSTSPVRAWGRSKPGSLSFHRPQRRHTKMKWRLP